MGPTQMILSSWSICDIFVVFPQWEPVSQQVHRAVLRTGREVAVKVQRPNVERRLMSDISVAGIKRAMAKREMGNGCLILVNDG